MSQGRGMAENGEKQQDTREAIRRLMDVQVSRCKNNGREMGAKIGGNWLGCRMLKWRNEIMGGRMGVNIGGNWHGCRMLSGVTR